jgi:hypothetical protein
MRKRLISPTPQETASSDQKWLELEHLAQVEITSEDAGYPIEAALLPGTDTGWRASQNGEQTIRLIFDQPQKINRIRLLFLEPDAVRTQEFTLRWSPDGGQSFREIVRQQWNFSPPDATQEIEEYRVELSGVTVLELTIIPDKSGGEAQASLNQLRLA